ncbi:unnamed protein product [Sphagnum balticum]
MWQTLLESKQHLHVIVITRDFVQDSRSSLEEVLINSPVDDVTPIDNGRKENPYIQFTAYFISATKKR